MGELSLIGMGLHDENGLTLRGLDAAKNADTVYAEFYTSIMPGLSLDRLQHLLGKEVEILSRKDLEEDAERTILSKAKKARVVLLAPGDPMSATTHVGLLLSAKKQGIWTEVIHSASILTAVSGVTGLEAYKFGRTVTIPSPKTSPLPESVYEFIVANNSIGLHTLALLDLEHGGLMIPEAIRILIRLESIKRAGLLTEDTLMVGLARVEAPDCLVRAGKAGDLLKSDFGGPPWSIIIPSKLHFVEAEGLQLLAGASRELLEARV
jgi:diphthine synthase